MVKNQNITKIKKLSIILLLIVSLIFPPGVFGHLTLSADSNFEPVQIAHYDFEGETEGWFGTGPAEVASVDEVGAASGDYSLKVTDRASSWDGPGRMVTDILEQGIEYEITAFVRRAEGSNISQFTMSMQEDPAEGSTDWNNLISANVSDETWTELSSVYSFDEEMLGLQLYIETDAGGAEGEFYIDNVIITQLTPAPDSSFEPVQIAHYDFEDGTAEGWAQRGGEVSLESVTDESNTGDRSLLVTGRKASHEGPSLNVLGKFEKGVTYEIKGYVKRAEASDSSQFKFSIENRPEGGTTDWTTVEQLDVDNTEWTELTGTYTYDVDMEHLLLYAESSNATESFYLDNVTITQLTPSPGEQEEPGELEPGVVTFHGFENNNFHGWVTRGGAGALAITEEDAHTGESSLRMFDRVEDWHMARIDLTPYLESGALYHLELFAKLPEDSTIESTDMNLSILPRAGTIDLEEVDLSGEVEVTKDSWVKLEGEYLYDEALTNAFLYVYARDVQTPYLIDDFTLTIIAAGPEQPELDSFHYDFEDGQTEGWFGRGDAQVASVDEESHTGDFSLKSTGREDTWQGPGLNVLNILEQGATYEITAYVKRAEDPATSEFRMSIVQQIEGAASPNYPNLSIKDIVDTEWTELKGTYSFEETMSTLELYFESDNPTEEFYLDNVTIKMISAPPLDQSGIFTDFEDGTNQGWSGRSGTETLIATTDDAFSGEYSLLTTGRTDGWHGPSINVIDKLHREHRYNVSVWVKLAPGEDPTNVHLSLQRGLDGQNNFERIASGSVTAGDWVFLSGTYTLAHTVDVLSIYVEADGPSGGPYPSYYIDDFHLEYLPPEDIQRELPDLKEVYAEHFQIGAAITPAQMIGMHSELLKKHYNSIVAENIMKPETIQPQPGNFNWTDADAMFNFAEDNDMVMRFHTLVWHSQTPNWFFLDENGDEMIDETDPAKREANKELLLERMETHITAVVDRYKGRVDSWDVVNEVISDGGGMRNSKWYQVTGTEFIEQAFHLVRELDPDSKLYINDYNTHNIQKRDALYELVVELLDKGVPIDGVGHQTHINLNYPSIDLIGASIEKFAGLGLDNQITELDLNIYTNDTQAYYSFEEIPEQVLLQQAYRYQALFEEFVRLSAHISNVTFWGIGDDHTWLHNRPSGTNRMSAPFVFDHNLQAKPSYWAIVDPAQIPTVTRNVNSAQGTPVIDGEAELLWQTTKEVEIAGNGLSATFKSLWDTQHIYLFIDVNDATVGAGDVVEIFFNETGNIEPDQVLSLARTSESSQHVVTERADGYSIEVAIPVQAVPEVDDSISLDIRITDGNSGTRVSWNDASHQQEDSIADYGTVTFKDALKIANAIYGTPTINAELDEIWENAQVLETDTWVEGTSGSTAQVRTMWDEENLYIFAEVTDAFLTTASNNPWEQDSVEIFVDQNNAKTDSYQGDDGQFRVNYENEQSYGGNASANNFTTATQVTETGYIIEAAIALDAITPEIGTLIGFDFQVNNDDTGNGSRDSVVTWNDPTGFSYMDTSQFGILHFVTELPEGPTDPTDPTEPVVVTKPTIKDDVAEIKDDAIEQVQQGGTIIIDLEDAADAEQIQVKLTAAQVEALIAKGATINVAKGNVGISISSAYFSGVEEVTFTLVRRDGLPYSAQALSEVYSFTILQGSLLLSQFGEQPVTLTFVIDPSKVTDPNHVRVYWFNEETGDWDWDNPLETTYDPETGMVTALTTHFSTFAVFEVAEVGVDPEPTDPEITDPEIIDPEVITPPADSDPEAEAPDGDTLPETASYAYNMLLIGFVILLVGLTTLVTKRRRNTV